MKKFDIRSDTLGMFSLIWASFIFYAIFFGMFGLLYEFSISLMSICLLGWVVMVFLSRYENDLFKHSFKPGSFLYVSSRYNEKLFDFYTNNKTIQEWKNGEVPWGKIIFLYVPFVSAALLVLILSIIGGTIDHFKFSYQDK